MTFPLLNLIWKVCSSLCHFWSWELRKYESWFPLKHKAFLCWFFHFLYTFLLSYFKVYLNLGCESKDHFLLVISFVILGCLFLKVFFLRYPLPPTLKYGGPISYLFFFILEEFFLIFFKFPKKNHTLMSWHFILCDTLNSLLCINTRQVGISYKI